MARDDVLHELGHGCRVPYVAPDEVDRRVVGWRAATDDDVRAARAIGVGDAAAEPAGPSCDEDDAAGEVRAQACAPVSSCVMASTARWPNAIAGVMQAPGPG